jgi:hypothetical protein
LVTATFKELDMRTLSTLCTWLLALAAGVLSSCGGGGGAGSESQQALAITGFTPAAGALDVPVATPVRASFDRPLDAAALNTSWITVWHGLTQVDGQLGLDASGSTLVFAPTTPLPVSASMVVRVSAAVRAAAGGLLGAAVEWNFATSAARAATDMTVTNLPDAADGELQAVVSRPLRTPAIVTLNNLYLQTKFWDAAAQGFASAASMYTGSLQPFGWRGIIGDASGAVMVALPGGSDIVSFHEDLSTGTSATQGHTDVRALLPQSDGNTLAWGLRGIPPGSSAGVAASSRYVSATRTWLHHPAALAYNYNLSSANEGEIVGFLPRDGESVQILRIANTAPRQLQSIIIDRNGNELTRVALSTNDGPMIARSDWQVDGRSIVVVLKATASGATISALDYEPSSGWGPLTQVATIEGNFSAMSSQIKVELGSGGHVLVAHAVGDFPVNITAYTRNGVEQWDAAALHSVLTPLQVLHPTVSPDGHFLLVAREITDFWVLGRRSGQEWSSARSGRSLGIASIADTLLSSGACHLDGRRFLILSGATILFGAARPVRCGIVEVQ